MRIEITLKPNRALAGTFILWNDHERIAVRGACLAKSVQSSANLVGNPTRDPLKPCGDTPLGFWIGCILTFLAYPACEYGAVPPIALRPVSGPAAQAYANGRRGLMVISGALSDIGLLRPTHGCVRLREDTLRAAVNVWKAAGGEPLPVSICEV
jgi:hypothetical protein